MLMIETRKKSNVAISVILFFIFLHPQNQARYPPSPLWWFRRTGLSRLERRIHPPVGGQVIRQLADMSSILLREKKKLKSS
jgi:hypothetical protein